MRFKYYLCVDQFSIMYTVLFYMYIMYFFVYTTRIRPVDHEKYLSVAKDIFIYKNLNISNPLKEKLAKLVH